MKEIIINKNRHYPFPYIPFGLPLWIKKRKDTVIVKSFMFNDTCMFDLHDEDQHDVNKLFGFSIGYHHKTSFRFGWRPKIENKTIEIVAYEYQNGIRQTTIPICEIQLNKWYSFKLIYSPEKQTSTYKVSRSSVDYKITSNDVKLNKSHGLGYTLRPYFGGNEKAPQKIIIFKQ